MTSENHAAGDQQDLLIRQYELYVQMADNASDRRSKTNAYYVSVTAAILVLAARSEWLAPTNKVEAVGLLLVAVVGALVCLVWKANVASFRQLSSAKFKVIHEMEQRLPFACYDREWELLGRGTDRKSYLQLTRIEPALPLALSVAYLVLFLIAVARLVAPA